MKTISTLAILVVLAVTSRLSAQDAPEMKMPQPQEEHEWLQQFVGAWKTHGELTMGPEQPPITCEGTESVRPVGKFWTISKSTNTVMETPMTGVMTLGYDPGKEKFVGTWVDSMNDHMWHYEGTLDETGKKLTLETEGPNPMKPGEMAEYREVLELKDKNHKVFTSSVKGPDGEWFTFVTIEAERQEKK